MAIDWVTIQHLGSIVSWVITAVVAYRKYVTHEAEQRRIEQGRQDAQHQENRARIAQLEGDLREVKANVNMLVRYVVPRHEDR